LTRHASPREASHAPNVSITIIRNRFKCESRLEDRIIRRVRLRIRASRASRVISRCERWAIIEIKAIKIQNGIIDKGIKVRGIVLGRNFFLWFTRPLRIYY